MSNRLGSERWKKGYHGMERAKRILALLIVIGGCQLLTPIGVNRPASAQQRTDIVVAQSPLLQRFDPINQITTTDYMVHSLIYDGLVNLGPDGFYPALATEWKVSPDGMTIDFTLRKDVKFSNGDAFTAEDVKFSFEGILSEKSTHGYRRIFVDSLREVEVVDPLHARFHMKQPWAAFFEETRGGAMQAIIPHAYYKSVGPEGFEKKPVGTGPYKLDSLKAGEWTRYVANEGYWQGPPAVKAVTQRLVKEPFTRLAQVQTGEADIAAGITGPLLLRARETSGLRVIYSRYNGTNSLQFQKGTNPLFKDKRVRLAIAHALDRAAMSQSILAGLCEPATHFFTPATFGFDASLSQIPYDPARAKQLLAEAGFKPGYETDFIIHSEEFASSPGGPEMLEAIAGAMEQLGFKLNRKRWDTAAYLRAQRGNLFTGVFYGTSVMPTDGGGLMSSYYITGSIPNNGAISLPEYDKFYADQLKETDPKKRVEILHQFTKLERENVEAIPLFWCHYSFVLGPRVLEMKPGRGSAYHLNLNQAKLAK
ncbi:MAG: ABC transporter substrate-binding protein [Pseudorhodoplanes sp.]|uniref:ABC transporter substrate-binding protein n=1 Tax=Pseudorhodoplanes sp. TaxID=1934341 RepID=UPI003D0B7BD6